jgi:hypothetical protein
MSGNRSNETDANRKSRSWHGNDGLRQPKGAMKVVLKRAVFIGVADSTSSIFGFCFSNGAISRALRFGFHLRPIIVEMVPYADFRCMPLRRTTKGLWSWELRRENVAVCRLGDPHTGVRGQ